MTADLALGYTGAYQDPVTGGYPLGNGCRMYLPELMRFAAQDDLSPFGEGGFNPYVYCADDPINHADPSGHFSLNFFGWLGLGIDIVETIAGVATAPFTGGLSLLETTAAIASAFSGVTGVARTIEAGAGNENAAQILGYVSQGVGIAATPDMPLVSGLGAVSLGTGIAAEHTDGTAQTVLSDIAMGTGLATAAPYLARGAWKRIRGARGAYSSAKAMGKDASAVESSPARNATAYGAREAPLNRRLRTAEGHLAEAGSHLEVARASSERIAGSDLPTLEGNRSLLDEAQQQMEQAESHLNLARSHYTRAEALAQEAGQAGDFSLRRRLLPIGEE